MRIEPNWKRPLFYLALPVILYICFMGFPPPFPPPRNIRAAQEQSVPDETDTESRKQAFESQTDVLGHPFELVPGL